MLNDDYYDILRALSDAEAEFLLVGAYAMALHGYVRATGDIDIWIKASTDNAMAVLNALRRFGAPLDSISLEDFTHENVVFQIGIAPRRIDLLTSVDGLDFDTTAVKARYFRMRDLDIRVVSLADLIISKRATGRIQDAADAEVLEGLSKGQKDDAPAH